MSSMDKLAKELKNMMTASDDRKPKPYDTQAEVLRVENDIAWVHIPGGVEETPVRLTLNAKKGDMVNIHVASGSAWITGNGTNPPTDDTEALVAKGIATIADGKSEKALSDAGRAQAAADFAEAEAIRAKNTADAVHDIATQAQEDADDAKEAAKDAQTSAKDAGDSASQAGYSANQALENARQTNIYARSALASLANIEDVVDTLGWIAEHGTYIATTDTSVNPKKSYYQHNGENYEMVPVPISTYLADMYELVITISYKQTEDRTVDNSKTYYTYDSQNDIYVPVQDPVDEDLPLYFEKVQTEEYILTEDQSAVEGKTYYAYDATNGTYSAETPTATIGQYYELQLDESVRNYLMTHIALTEEGLTLVKDDNAYYILIAADGIYIKNHNGGTVASYGSEIILGEEINGVQNVITSTRLSFRTASGDIAYFGLNDEDIWEMHIDTSFVDDMLRFGDYAWIKRSNGNMTLKWLGV